MIGRLHPVQLAIYSLLAIYVPEMERICPWLVSSPSARADETPQAFMAQLPGEVKAVDEAGVHSRWIICSLDEAAEYLPPFQKRLKLPPMQGADLIFYGDSITELWRGTDQGRPWARTKGAPELFAQYFGNKYRTQVLGVGGDQVAHLHWRLLHGSLPTLHHPKLAVILIGINDILMGNACWRTNAQALEAVGNATAYRITSMMELLLEKLPVTHFVVLSILPARDWADRKTAYEWPNGLTPGILSANHWIAKICAAEDRLTHLDCNHHFIGHNMIEPRLQGDGVHPSGQGLEVLAQCIQPVVEHYMHHGEHTHHTHAHEELHADIATVDGGVDK